MKDTIAYEIRMWWEWFKRTAGIITLVYVANLLHLKIEKVSAEDNDRVPVNSMLLDKGKK